MNRQQLIEDNINLVYYIISHEYPSYLRDEDVVQSGMLGLCRAAKTWKEQSNFANYAGKCIRGEIKNEFIRRKPHYQNISLETKIGEDGTLGDVIIGENDIPYFDNDLFFETLTAEEKEVLSLDSAGYSTYEIAEMKNYSVQKIQKILRIIKCKWRQFDEN